MYNKNLKFFLTIDKCKTCQVSEASNALFKCTSCVENYFLDRIGSCVACDEENSIRLKGDKKIVIFS